MSTLNLDNEELYQDWIKGRLPFIGVQLTSGFSLADEANWAKNLLRGVFEVTGLVPDGFCVEVLDSEDPEQLRSTLRDLRINSVELGGGLDSEVMAFVDRVLKVLVNTLDSTNGFDRNSSHYLPQQLQRIALLIGSDQIAQKLWLLLKS